MSGSIWRSGFFVRERNRPVSQLEEILAEFQNDLKRASELLVLVKDFRSFAGSTVPAEVVGGSVPWPEAEGLAAAAPQVRTDLPILSGSLLLYICGRFEYFVREVVVTLADELADAADTYQGLPDRLRKELHDRTLDVAQNPRRYGYTESEVAQLLVVHAGNLAPGSATSVVTISSRLVSITESNMNQRTVAEVFKRVNIPDIWGEIGKQAPLKAHLAEADDRECSTAAGNRLDTLMSERNGVAHPTGTTTFPDPDQVLLSVDLLGILSKVLIDVARIPR